MSTTSLLLAIGVAAIGGFLIADQFVVPSSASAAGAPAVAMPAPVDCSTLPPVSPPNVTWQLPGDFSMPQQGPVNQFAWQEFIALNWTADSGHAGTPNTTVGASGFGMPGDTRPVVWETYMVSSDVFRPDAVPPKPWGSGPTVPENMSATMKQQIGGTTGVGDKFLVNDSKFDGGPRLDLSEFGQASAGAPWLTAQNGYLTYYEKRLNEAEYQYIVDQKLYDASCQRQVATTAGIQFPSGSGTGDCYSSGQCGAIEVKAAWMPLTPKDDPSTFKISRAWIYNPASKIYELRTVGLVGLHIIHKTQRGQQFIWATFEHVANAPNVADVNGGTVAGHYNYFNPNCNPAKDAYKCQANHQPTPNDPYAAPIQVVRMFPIPANNTNNVGCLNQAAWNAIRTANPHSVFLNYELVNVVWPNTNTTVKGPVKTPLPQGDPQPKTIVANTTMETYVQTTLSCLDCHSFAAIAETPIVKVTKHPKTLKAATQPYASDYSFLMSEAQMPSHPTCLPSQKK